MSGKTRKIKIQIPFAPQPYQLESLEHPARFKVIIRGRRGGKTEEELHGAIRDAVINPGLHWITAPSYRQIKSIAWTRLKAILKNDTNWIFNEQELYAENKTIISPDGRYTRIELKGCDKEDSLVGVGLRSLRMDEAALTKKTVWENVLRPMLADFQAPAWFYTTPRGRNWVYDLFMRGQGDDASWKSWRQPTSINSYIHPDEIAEAKKEMPERLFRQEFLAEFVTDDTGVFKGIRQCIVGELKPAIYGRFYVMGVDLAKTYDFSVLTVVDSVTREVVAFERFQDISWQEQKLRIQLLAQRYNNALCVIDATGIGDPIVEDLQSANISLYYDGDKPGYKFTHESKLRLIDNLSLAIEQRLVTFPRIDILVGELFDYEYVLTPGGKITYSAPDGKHDDCVVSLALAVWGIRHQLRSAHVVMIDSDQQMILDRQGRGERRIIEDEELISSGY